eukprot:CAMPEP_0197304904 /NCGR_PEP_ID=MMETSP0891-20130614/540_1 /TAXON_ID=44058 ORGANISM="Aureoumbra lagunensis, Strain CCMP1510" /NCGR_SAMPLE_ID=MMETSP0891 /ASSEMBLY_ACC=CAM_ASM_000534 /LENGTH=168 /DNA_ID=CAMNT_0042785283 /DNA_START=198 /DNA_END=705 /DNA_ORIENTATION=-
MAAFLSKPSTPLEGIPKGGTPSSRVGAHLKSAGEAAGINFTGKCDRTPNTSLFHASMSYLQVKAENGEIDKGIPNQFQEEAFLSYFTYGEFPDQAGLLKAAERANAPLDPLFQNPQLLRQYADQASQEAMQHHLNGISGIPFFFFNEKPAFSGARPVDDFMSVLTQLP